MYVMYVCYDQNDSIAQTNLVVIPDTTLAPMLRRDTHKLNAFTDSFLIKRMFFPPGEFYDMLTASGMHPRGQAGRYKPAEMRSKPLVQLYDGLTVEMIIVVVTNDYGVDVWQLIDSTRCTSVACSNTR